jgi:hypothetical protein
MDSISVAVVETLDGASVSEPYGAELVAVESRF